MPIFITFGIFILVKHLLKYITKTIWILSILSLLNDAASDLLYPVMPIYLSSIGFSVLLVGILEGVAEAISGLSKGYFGKWSDNSGKRKPFIMFGYALSAISKPLLVVFAYPVWVFFARTLDRFGKGIRGGARDALLSDESTPQTKGKVFGFHRSMDTLGAVIGPSIALAYLFFYPKDYINLIYVTIIPGVLTVAATLLIKEKKKEPQLNVKKTSPLAFIKYWKVSPPNYKKLVVGLLLFALFNSSDMLLILKVKDAGMDDSSTIGIYIFYNLIYAIFAFPMGMLADKIGLKKVFLIGLIVFAIVYGSISLYSNIYFYGALFFLYGVFTACTDGISKAWISNITDKKDTATAIGTFTGFQSICLMLASTITGFLWYQFGPITAFITTSVVTIAVIFYFIFVIKYQKVST